MTRTAFNRRYDLVALLAHPGPSEGKPDPEPEGRRLKRVRDSATRPSHLRAKRYHPTHPLVKISKVLPAKLPTMAELEALSHEELGSRFLKVCHKFK